MAIHISDSLSLVRLMAKVFTPGRMAKSTTENGIKESNRATAFGRVSKMILILASGPLRKRMATECIIGRMATDTKVSGKCASSMAKVQIALPMVMCTQGNTSMASHMARESMFGLQARCTPVTSFEAKSMEKVNGEAREMFRTVMYTKVTIKMIENTAKVFSLGLVATFTKEIMWKMKDKEMDKCSGRMAVCTKANGSAVSNTVSAGWSFQMEIKKKAILRIMSSDTQSPVKTPHQASRGQDLI